MESIGDYLKRERELRNITLEEVANATKINIGTLRAIEEGRKELLPAEVFIRGFIRCYAEYIGLDPNDVLLRYPRPAKEPKEISPPAEKSGREFFSRYRKYLWTSISIIILVSLLGLIVYMGQKSSSTQPAPQKEVLKKEQNSLSSTSANANRVVEQAKAHIEGQTSIPAPQAKVQTAQKQLQDKKQHELRAIFKENTWIQALIDENTLEEYSFKPGETFTWAMDDKIKLLIGNAGGVDFYLDDKPVKPLGNSGQVVNITLPNPELM